MNSSGLLGTAQSQHTTMLQQQQLMAAGTLPITTATPQQTVAAPQQTGLPQVITNSHGQIVSLSTPQVCLVRYCLSSFTSLLSFRSLSVIVSSFMSLSVIVLLFMSHLSLCHFSHHCLSSFTSLYVVVSSFTSLAVIFNTTVCLHVFFHVILCHLTHNCLSSYTSLVALSAQPSPDHTCIMVVHNRLRTTHVSWWFTTVSGPHMYPGGSQPSPDHTCILVVHNRLRTTHVSWWFTTVSGPHMYPGGSQPSPDHTCILVVHPLSALSLSTLHVFLSNDSLYYI